MSDHLDLQSTQYSRGKILPVSEKGFEQFHDNVWTSLMFIRAEVHEYHWSTGCSVPTHFKQIRCCDLEVQHCTGSLQLGHNESTWEDDGS